MTPVTIGHTWRNNRVGINRVSNRLNKFLVNEGLLNDSLRTKHCVGVGGEFDHFPIYDKADASS